MKYIVYILMSLQNGKYYVGQTDNIMKRLARHNSGRNKSTKSGAPWKMVYTEEYNTRSESFAREQQIKKYKGGAAFKKLLE